MSSCPGRDAACGTTDLLSQELCRAGSHQPNSAQAGPAPVPPSASAVGEGGLMPSGTTRAFCLQSLGGELMGRASAQLYASLLCLSRGVGLWGSVCTTDSSSPVQGMQDDVSAGVGAVSALQGQHRGAGCAWGYRSLLAVIWMSGRGSPSPQLRFLFEFCGKCGKGRTEWGSPGLH